MYRMLPVFVFILFINACSTNPLTGETQLSLPISQQIEMGNKNYGLYTQQQGGRYVVDPDLNLYVSAVGKKVAAHSPVKLPYEFTVLNNDVPNAWALPGGKIAINRGLLVLLEDEAQLAAVLGHEVTHAAAEHSANQMIKSQIVGAGGAVLAGVAGGDSEIGAALGLGAMLGGKLYLSHYGRSQELEADKFGIDFMIKAGYEPYAAVELQQTFVKLSQGQQSDFLSNLFASHPPSTDRVEANKKRVANLSTGKRNKTEFQRATRQIRKDLPAYKLNNEALAAAGKKDYTKALALTEKAIKKQPNEAQFYVTKGQILLQQNKTSQASRAFELATKKNPDHFMGYLALGLSQKKRSQYSPARGNLEKSLQYLPTQIAQYHLGEIALKQGDKGSAINYFNAVAQQGGDLGKSAQAQLSKISPSGQTPQ